jgi:hypothetical protein
MMHPSSRTRRGRAAAVNVLVAGGLGYFVLGLSRDLAVLILAATTLSVLLERVEAP